MVRGAPRSVFSSLLLGGMLFSHAVVAQETQPVAPSVDQRGIPPPGPPAGAMMSLVVPLIVNHKNLGDISVSIDATGGAWIDSERFTALLRPVIDAPTLQGLLSQISGHPQITPDMASVAGLVTRFDPAGLELDVQIDMTHLGIEKMSFIGRAAPDFSQMRPPARLSGALSATLDQRYLRDNGGTVRSPLVVDMDGFVTVGGFEGLTARFGGEWTENAHGRKWRRSKTYLLHDNFSSATRWIAGEYNPSITGFQGSASMLGVNFNRSYQDIRPFENIHPSGRSALTLDRDSTVIVMVNGVENRRLRLLPGRYEFSDFGVPYGASTVTLFVEDAAGRREAALLSLFNSVTLLEAGVSDFGISAGKREGSLFGVYDGPALASGYYRRGITNTFTLGAGGQAGNGNALLSGDATFGLAVGILSVTTAQTHFKGRSGSAFALDYRNEVRLSDDNNLTLTLSAQSKSRNFQTPFEVRVQPVDERWRVDTRLEWRHLSTTLVLGTHAANYRFSPATRGWDLTGTKSFSTLSASLTVGRERLPSGRDSTFVTFAINVPIGERASVSARYDTESDHLRTVEASRYPIEQVGDVSGRIVVSEDSHHRTFGGDMSYISNRFNASIEHNQTYARLRDEAGKFVESRARFSTGLAFADGVIGIGRPASQGFILMPLHESLSGAGLALRDEGGRVIARNGVLGPLLAPIHSTYSERSYLVEADKLPEGYDLGDVAPRLFASSASGYRVQIGSAYWKMAMGYLGDDIGPLTEHSAIVRSANDKGFVPQTIFTNSAGRFVAIGLAPGVYDLEVNDTAMAHFTIPNDRKGIIDVGQIHIPGDMH